jgi:hypothetical protein
MQPDSFSAVIQFVQSYWTVFTTASVLTGLCLVGTGLVHLNRRRQEGGGIAIGFTGMAVGAAFINVPGWIDMWSLTLLGVHASVDPLSYGTSGAAVNTGAVRAILGILGTVGAYGIAKGLLLFRESVYDRQAFWPAVRHTVGGVFGVNFATAAQLLAPLVPGPVQNLLQILS